MSKPTIVSIGFLTQRDLDRLGQTFTNHIPIPAEDDMFADLLGKLDRIEIEPLGKGIVIMPNKMR